MMHAEFKNNARHIILFYVRNGSNLARATVFIFIYSIHSFILGSWTSKYDFSTSRSWGWGSKHFQEFYYCLKAQVSFFQSWRQNFVERRRITTWSMLSLLNLSVRWTDGRTDDAISWLLRVEVKKKSDLKIFKKSCYQLLTRLFRVLQCNNPSSVWVSYVRPNPFLDQKWFGTL